MNDGNSNWCCRGCGQLLGIIDGDRLEIRSARGHQYLVGFPVTCVCRNPRCNTLNELRDPKQIGMTVPEAAAQL